MFELIKAAGWPAYPLLLASIVAVAIVIDRLMAFQRFNKKSKDIIDMAEASLSRGARPLEAATFAAGTPWGRLLMAFELAAPLGQNRLEERVQDAGRLAIHEFSRRIEFLGTIASISPLMGLFGTVVGMIEMFANTGIGHAANTQEFAHGISIALYNTAFGLVVAVPSLLAYRHLRAKQEVVAMRLEQGAAEFVEILFSRKSGESNK